VVDDGVVVGVFGRGALQCDGLAHHRAEVDRQLLEEPSRGPVVPVQRFTVVEAS